MQGMHLNIQMDDTEVIIARRHLQKGGEVQKYIDSEVLRLSEPYIPKLSGVLSNSGTSNTVIGNGEVVYRTPYARYQYYGKVMVGPAPKTVTNKDLKYHGGGARGSKWFERMKAAHKDDILKGAAQIAGGKAE